MVFLGVPIFGILPKDFVWPWCSFYLWPCLPKLVCCLFPFFSVSISLFVCVSCVPVLESISMHSKRRKKLGRLHVLRLLRQLILGCLFVVCVIVVQQVVVTLGKAAQLHSCVQVCGSFGVILLQCDLFFARLLPVHVLARCVLLFICLCVIYL